MLAPPRNYNMHKRNILNRMAETADRAFLTAEEVVGVLDSDEEEDMLTHLHKEKHSVSRGKTDTDHMKLTQTINEHVTYTYKHHGNSRLLHLQSHVRHGRSSVQHLLSYFSNSSASEEETTKFSDHSPVCTKFKCVLQSPFLSATTIGTTNKSKLTGLNCPRMRSWTARQYVWSQSSPLSL